MGENRSHYGLEAPCPKLGTTLSLFPVCSLGPSQGQGPGTIGPLHSGTLSCDSQQVLMCSRSPPRPGAGYLPGHLPEAGPPIPQLTIHLHQVSRATKLESESEVSASPRGRKGFGNPTFRGTISRRRTEYMAAKPTDVYYGISH